MFEDLISEVKEMHERILAECEKNDEISKLYKGCQIFFSPVEKHEVMLIGINPGSGYSRSEEERVEIFEPLSEHEYFKYDYALAHHVKDIFTRANKIEKLKDSIKTNLFFWATYGEDSFGEFLTKISDPQLRDDIYETSKKWIREIVEQVTPQIIICEGTGNAYNNLKDRVFKGKFIEEEVGSGRIKIGKIGNINVLAFKRSRSNVANETKDELIPLLNKYL